MNRRIAVVAGLAVIGVLATSDRPASRACPVLPCVGYEVAVCVWDPVLNPLCSEDTPPTGTCKCSDYTTPRSCADASYTMAMGFSG
jgi:hypothetical protein